MTTELQSPTIHRIAAALVAAQATMGVALKDTVNGHFKTKYADLASIINAAREPLAANGLAVIQRAHPNDRGVQLQTTLIHSSGEWLSDGGLHLPATKVDPQGFGSAMTYARRYGYAAMLGIVQDDDDGAAAVASQQAARERAVKLANEPRLTGDQTQILTMIAKSARPDRTPDLSDKLAEDYAAHVKTFLAFAVKEKAVEAGDAPDVEGAALKLDAAGVKKLLGSVKA